MGEITRDVSGPIIDPRAHDLRNRYRDLFGGDGDGIGIDIKAGEFDSKISRMCPALDTTQPIAVAAADVEDAQRLWQLSGRKAVEPIKKR